MTAHELDHIVLYVIIDMNMINMKRVNIILEYYHIGYGALGLWYAHWDYSSGIGRGVVADERFVDLLKQSESDPSFYVTRHSSSGGYQNSLEVKFADDYVTINPSEINPLNYWLVLTMFTLSSSDDGWNDLYFRAPMFWRKYIPEVVKP